MIKMNDPNCSGCGACVSVCPTHALKMVEDEEGFLRPVLIFPEKCIGCEKCYNICSTDISNKTGKILEVYYGHAKDSSTLYESTSGGAFSVIANYVLERGGCVWGVEMTKEGKTAFCKVNSEDELYRIRGSKYVEVSEAIPFEQVYDQLRNESRLLLFSGTPCQVKALYFYLKNKKCNLERLILVDLFCYGVQSNKAFRAYLKEINPRGLGINHINMRRKKPNWEMYSMDILFDDGTKYFKSRWEDPYLRTYSKGLFNRVSCSCCEAKSFPRHSDLTLGDFWGVDGLSSPTYFKINRGLSIIIANSEKGREIFKSASCDRFQYETIDKDELNRLYPLLGKSNKMHNKRKNFMCGLKDNVPFSELVRKYAGSELEKKKSFKRKPLQRLKRRIKYVLKKFF